MNPKSGAGCINTNSLSQKDDEMTIGVIGEGGFRALVLFLFSLSCIRMARAAAQTVP